MPLSTHTITRLDPAVPLLWRDGDTLQIGIEGTLRIPASAPWVEQLLARMAAGFRRSAFDVIAHSLGAPHTEARALYSRLEPLLVDEVAVHRAAWVESIDVRDGRCEYRLREALLDEGVPPGDPRSSADVAVVLVEGAAAALHFRRHLRDDVPHLPVALERGRVTVGPLVVPGASPCLACRDAHECDRDPAWPRLHAQLIGRAAGPVSAVRIADAAIAVAAVLTAGADGAVLELSGGVRRELRRVTFHAECRCREQSFLSPTGSATAPVPLGRRIATTTLREYARPA